MFFGNSCGRDRAHKAKLLSVAPESSTGGAEMWKPEHRRAAVRHGLRYPSDLTDAEWVLVEPMIPPAKRGGRDARRMFARFSTQSSTCSRPVANGRRCRRTCRRKARRVRTHAVGLGRNIGAHPAHTSMSLRASARAGKPAQLPQSSTVKAPKRERSACC